jgi:hypothetical protein
MSYLFAWPLLAILTALTWTFLAPDTATRPWPRAAALTLGALPAIVLVAPVVHVLFALLTYMEPFLPVPMVGVPLFVVALALSALLPAFAFLTEGRRWALPAGAALAGLLLIGYGALTSGYDTAHPRPNSIAYVLDADTGVASWVSADGRLDAWTRQFFPDGATRGSFVGFPNNATEQVMPAWQGPAPVVDLPAPEIAVLSDTTAGDRRTLRLRATSPRGAPNFYLEIRAADLLAATLDGKPLDVGLLPPEQRARFRLAYYALPPEGIELGLTVPAAGSVTVRAEDRSHGLPPVPGLTIAPRPPDTMMAPFDGADPTIVSRTFTLAP